MLSRRCFLERAAAGAAASAITGWAAATRLHADDSPAAAAAPRLGLVVGEDGTLRKGPAAFRGVGVNYPDAFWRTLASPADTSYDAGFEALAAHGVPFARFPATGFWPRDLALYRTGPEDYLARMDGVVRSAEKHGVGLIPSLFWYFPTVPDLVGESCDQWGNPQSKTHEFMRGYTRAVVTRYRNSAAVWGWEFGNEYDLAKDLPPSVDKGPPVVPHFGTPGKRTERDALSHAMVATAVRAFAREVRCSDPHRFITSGNSMPRPAAWHLRKDRSWTPDSPAEFEEMIAEDNPDPINVISVHAYGEDIARIARAAEAAAKVKKPLFVGECQIEKPAGPDARKRFDELLERVAAGGAAVAAVWSFDFAHQPSFTATNELAYQLKAIGAANRRLARIDAGNDHS
jgi:hypothetical protein